MKLTYLKNPSRPRFPAILAIKNIFPSVPQKKQIESLEEEAIKTSLKNLISFPDIINAIEKKTLSIHGLIHDIGSGEIKYLNPSTEGFEKI